MAVRLGRGIFWFMAALAALCIVVFIVCMASELANEHRNLAETWKPLLVDTGFVTVLALSLLLFGRAVLYVLANE